MYDPSLYQFDTSKKLAVIGDIHGCIDELNELVELLHDCNEIVFCGDLVDRGPDSRAVVRRVKQLVESGRSVCVRGNHDHVIAESWKKGKPASKHLDIEVFKSLSPEDCAFLGSLPTLYEPIFGLLVVHAGLDCDRPAYESSDDSRMYLRAVDDSGQRVRCAPWGELPAGAHQWATQWRGWESVCYGHDCLSFTEPVASSLWGGSSTCWGLDTGCVFGGRLTAGIYGGVRRSLDGGMQRYMYEYRYVKAQQIYHPWGPMEKQSNAK